MSVRVLQLAFREHLGYSPYRYLRLCRLNQLQAALRESKCRQASVTQLMEQYGFNEFGRSAGEYRRLFGESPSKTLARS